VRTERCGVERFVLDDFGADGITYVVPRSNDCILGGTVEEGRESLEADESTTLEILARCRALEPRLEQAKLLGANVGLRPGRPEVRLEAEPFASGRLVVHNYGHGGAGVTLSWGCADEVCELVRA
jgi:D-amino-acid oxidase